MYHNVNACFVSGGGVLWLFSDVMMFALVQFLVNVGRNARKLTDVYVILSLLTKVRFFDPGSEVFHNVLTSRGGSVLVGFDVFESMVTKFLFSDE